MRARRTISSKTARRADALRPLPMAVLRLDPQGGLGEALHALPAGTLDLLPSVPARRGCCPVARLGCERRAPLIGSAGSDSPPRCQSERNREVRPGGCCPFQRPHSPSAGREPGRIALPAKPDSPDAGSPYEAVLPALAASWQRRARGGSDRHHTPGMIRERTRRAYSLYPCSSAWRVASSRRVR